MLTLLFLIILLGGGRGFGANLDAAGVAGVDRTVVNEANNSRLLDAISTTGARQEAAIQGLATALNCDVQAIQGALCGIDKALAVNQGSIINAIQSCCCNIRTEILQSQNALQSQLAKCCCDTNLNIERTGNGLMNEIQQTRFQIQTTDAATRQFIQQAFCDQNAYLAQQFCDIKTREDAREIQSLRDKLEQARTEAQTAVLLNAVNGTKCVNARYDTTTQTICGSVGARNCCCNRIGTTPTPAPTETDLEAETAPVKGKSKSKAE